MLIKNAKIFVGKSFLEGDIRFGKTIEAVGRLEGEADWDAKGCYVVPGLVDVHTHGAVGEDFSDGKAEGMQPLADYYAAHGVTSYLATTMTLKEETLTPAMHVIRDFHRAHGAKCAGVHLEGPFLCYDEASGGQVKLVTVACEEEGGMDFVSQVSQVCTVSLGHTCCTYDQAMEAFARGASHATHLFNGMDGLHHRKPGLIAAAMDAGASVELICDGLHIHPAVIRLVHNLYGDRLNLISDSLRCAGMPDGDYELGGQSITVKNGKACLTGTDTLAGSSISMLDAVRNVVRFGLPLADAVYAASTAPALAVGLKDVGSIACGKAADLLVLDHHLQLKAVYVDGEQQ